MALIDDAVLWIGLAALLVAANVGIGMQWGLPQMAALVCVLLLTLVSALANRYTKPVHSVIVGAISIVFLIAGTWASSRLNVHELIGAYVAGALLPPH